jgi:predicted ester cyclase
VGPEENAAAVRDFVARAWNEGEEAVFEEHLADDFAAFGGREGFRQVILGYRAAFPDLHMRIDDNFGAGDRVVTRFTVTGTHEGELLGIPPTGRKVEVGGIAIDVMRDGKRVDGWVEIDRFGLMSQLGVIEAPGPMSE